MIYKLVKIVRNDRSIGARLCRFAKKHKVESLREVVPKNFDKYIEIIIPCYNHARYLPDAFNSVANQTYKKPFTVTLADDCSTDDTPRVIEDITNKQYKNITCKVIKNKKNLRQWGSLNNAIGQSANKLIVILNDDDMLLPDCLEKIVDTYKKHPEIYMLGGSSIWLNNGKLQRKHTPKPLAQLQLTIHEPEEVTRYTQLNDLNMTQSSCSFYRVAWEATGGYTPKNKRIHPDANEDRDFQMRVASLFPVGTYDNYPFAIWRTDSSHGKNF